jgi:hypothetical protein
VKYKHPGLPSKDRKEKMKRDRDMVKFLSGQEIKKKREVKKDRSDKGKSHGKPEEELRNNIKKELIRSGFKYARLENSILGGDNNGIPDVLVSHRIEPIMGWIEIKTPENWRKNKLSPKQRKFRQDCRRCGVKHWIIRSLEELQSVKLGETVYEPEVDDQC